jgi:hypothetical protein
MPLIDLDLRPEAGPLRRFGVAAALLLLVAALLAPWPAPASAALGVLALGTGALAWARPRALLWPYVALSLLLHPLGLLVSYVVLAGLFFGLVTPLGLLLRALRHDPLRLHRPPGAGTRWVERKGAGDLARYFRQS